MHQQYVAAIQLASGSENVYHDTSICGEYVRIAARHKISEGYPCKN